MHSVLCYAQLRNHMEHLRFGKPPAQAAILRSLKSAVMYVWSADSISCFVSSKLLPRTVIESSAQAPFHPSASGQKVQSTGTDAMTGTLTACDSMTFPDAELVAAGWLC